MKRKYIQPQTQMFSFKPVLMTVTSMLKDSNDKVRDEDEILSRGDTEDDRNDFDLWDVDGELDDGLSW